ncbi:MAG: hypothetical protein SOZ80_07480 [Prevotella sp.]|uniref:hypothetical protein n=1 Tax=Prevotella sp. TaxID=59823 RepID=UPI002A2D575C|nr:hypothetical protein [Prevotella sp.]MDD7317557.1 hypothetical protein [Prevotellaceae bacterium]MDY4020596.1 hypothetical protein [Prevotella sp.]
MRNPFRDDMQDNICQQQLLVVPYTFTAIADFVGFKVGFSPEITTFVITNGEILFFILPWGVMK